MTNTDETQTTSTQSESTSFWRRKPTLWVGGGVAAAALLAGGVGIGAASAGDDDDDYRPVATRAADDEAAEVSASSGVRYGSDDADALARVLATASTESSGTPTSMEAHRNGAWSVDFDAANGDETTVLVAADGSASVVRTEAADGDDANDPAPAGTLTAQTIADAVKAALHEEQGTVIGIDLDDDPAEAYSVQVLSGNGAETEIDLDSTFKVTKVDVDND